MPEYPVFCVLCYSVLLQQQIDVSVSLRVVTVFHAAVHSFVDIPLHGNGLLIQDGI